MALLTGAALLAAACAINPVSGRPEVVLVSTGQERRIGEEQALVVERRLGLVQDPELAAYVAEIGGRLVAHSPRRDVAYAFHVVDMVEPNAFALPGGFVYVSRGLIALANSEDELACVLGHEVGHVAARHAVQRATRAAPVAIVSGLGAAVTGIVSPTLGRLVGGVGVFAGAAFLAPFGRGQERQADRIGQELAARAGWDPAALSRFLQTLEREEALRLGERRAPGFFDTHPSTPDRVSGADAYALTLERAPARAIASGPGGFLGRIEGMLVGENPAEGVFDGEAFLQPELDFALRFPTHWTLRNARHAVAGVAPDGKAVVVLELDGEGDDPLAAARAAADASAWTEQPQLVPVGGAVGARGRLRREGATLEVTWVAHRGLVYRITAAAPDAHFAAHAKALRAVAQSFRALSAEERAGIREQRLRVVRARAGDTLDALVARSEATWSAAEAAVANALGRDQTLRDGQRVKLAVSVPYEPAVDRRGRAGPGGVRAAHAGAAT